MGYTPVGWTNSPSTTTPLDAANLGAMDAGIENAYGQFGTFAAMPVANTVNSGIIYFATDTHQTFQSNGASWVLLPAGSIAGVPVASTAPTTGQVLTYNGTDWVPQNTSTVTDTWAQLSLTPNNSPGSVPSIPNVNLYAYPVTTPPGTVLPAATSLTLTLNNTSIDSYANAQYWSVNTSLSGAYVNAISMPYPYIQQSSDNNFTWTSATSTLTSVVGGIFSFEFLNNGTWQTNLLINQGGLCTPLAGALTGGTAPVAAAKLIIPLSAGESVNLFTYIPTFGAGTNTFYLFGSSAAMMNGPTSSTDLPLSSVFIKKI